MRMILTAAALNVAAFTLPANAIELGMPLDCEIGKTCMIQNYVDAEPGEGAKDFNCGPLAYNNHQGTDFRLRNRSEIDKGYSALATAPGIVVSTINDQPDHRFTAAQDDPFGCGNAVMIDHGAGWVSQYCHLAKGSVRVSRGQSVTTGTPLGEIGSSGGTDFPHLHYAIRRFGAVINPFTGVSPTGCKATSAQPLWNADLGLGYTPSALFGFGVTKVFPSLEIVKQDHATLTAPESATEPFYIWLHLLGVRAGDSARLMAFGPDGRPFASELFEITEDETVYLANIGVSPSDMGLQQWPKGEYRARISFFVKGDEALREELAFDLPAKSKRDQASLQAQ